MDKIHYELSLGVECFSNRDADSNGDEITSLVHFLETVLQHLSSRNDDVPVHTAQGSNDEETLKRTLQKNTN